MLTSTSGYATGTGFRRQESARCDSVCTFFSSDSIGMKGKHIGPVIVAGHIQVEFTPRDIVQIQVRS